MHIVDTTLFFAPHSGGVKRYLLAKHQFLEGHPLARHTLVVPGAESRSSGRSIIAIRAPAIPFGGGYRLPLTGRAWREALCALQPDLIEVGDPHHPAWIALDAANRLGVPAVAFAHSDVSRLLASRVRRGVGAVVDAYLRSLYARFQLVLAPSSAVARRLTEIGVERVLVQPLGVDESVFHPRRRDPGLRAELGLPAGARLLIFAGRMAGEKRIALLRRAVDRLGAPYHLLLAGGTEARRCSDRVTLLPYQQDGMRLARLLASCDALVHAGEHETFGLVFLEAMACGRPVVGVRSGAVGELIDESIGRLADPGSADSLAQAIRSLYDGDFESMGLQARRRVECAYTWKRVLSLQFQRYAGLVRRAGIPRAASVLPSIP